MRRTHILHTRDNRRPHFGLQRDPNDRRPLLAWTRDGDRQIMTLDGQAVARVEPFGEAVFDPASFTMIQPHAAILTDGPRKGERVELTDSDAARLFCESVFAASSPR